MCTVEVQLNHKTIYMYTYKKSVTQYKLHYYSCCVAGTHHYKAKIVNLKPCTI